MQTIKCPKCRFNAAAFEKIDAKGAHYICPNCEHKWNDPTVKLKDHAEEEQGEYTKADKKKTPAASK